MTEALPVAPVIVLGPAAFRMKSVATFVPPLLLVMVFTKVNFGEMSKLEMAQVTAWLRDSLRLETDNWPAVQLQAVAV